MSRDRRPPLKTRWCGSFAWTFDFMAGLLVGVAEWEVASWEGTGSGVAVAGGDESVVASMWLQLFDSRCVVAVVW